MKIKHNVSLKNKSTFRTPAKCRIAFFPETKEDIKQVFSEHQNLYIIGGGSNILFSPSVIKEPVVFTKNIRMIRQNTDHEKTALTFGCGVSVKKAIETAIRYNLSGMEWAGGLPGTIGGAVFMNARCYGSEISNIFLSGTFIDISGQETTLKYNDMNFSYKQTEIQKKRGMLFDTSFLLKSSGRKRFIKKETLKHIKDRNQKKQFRYPSCGSVFKNSYEKSIIAGQIIEACGLKGLSVGGAKVYPHHANFIVNTGGASSDDIYKLIQKVKKSVFEEKGILLEEEIRYIGNF